MTEKDSRPVSPEVLMRAAVTEVDKLTRARRRDRYAWAAVGVALTGVAIVFAILFHQNSTLNSTNQRLQRDEQVLAAQARQNCLAGNEFRAGNEQIWTDFITLALANNPDPAKARALVAPFMAQVMRVDAPRDCTKLSH